MGVMQKPYYSDGSVTIYHGDCREIFPQLGHFDLLLTDPPYGINENSDRVASRSKLAAPTNYGAFSWDDKPADRALIDLARSKCDQSIIWGGNYFHLPPARGWLVWDKLNGTNNFADAELAWTDLEMSVRVFRFLWNGMLRAGEQRGKKRVHPTQKPLELMTWCLAFAPKANWILDPYAGSCTTGRAAKELGRRAVCIEREESYCEAGALRMSQEVLPLNAERN